MYLFPEDHIFDRFLHIHEVLHMQRFSLIPSTTSLKPYNTQLTIIVPASIQKNIYVPVMHMAMCSVLSGLKRSVNYNLYPLEIILKCGKQRNSCAPQGQINNTQ